MYLDNAATTKMHEEVITAMRDISFANYNAKYYDEAEQIHQEIDATTKKISELFNVKEKQIVYTSGATESNNYIIQGMFAKYPSAHYITSVLEHKCVLETYKKLADKGMNVTFLKPDENGDITLENVISNLKEDTKLVSLMYVNNETGIITNIPEISKELKKREILLHSDIAQAIGKVEIDFSNIDYASISAHKIYGPKGIGCAIINPEERPEPLLYGSEQQNNNRAGTLPNELIVGLGVALELVIRDLSKNKNKFKQDKNKLLKMLENNFDDDLIVNFEKNNTVDNIISIQIDGEINNIFLQDNKEFFKASTGSSCSVNQPSYVLSAMGFNEMAIRQTIRLSLSAYDELNI